MVAICAVIMGAHCLSSVGKATFLPGFSGLMMEFHGAVHYIDFLHRHFVVRFKCTQACKTHSCKVLVVFSSAISVLFLIQVSPLRIMLISFLNFADFVLKIFKIF